MNYSNKFKNNKSNAPFIRFVGNKLTMESHDDFSYVEITRAQDSNISFEMKINHRHPKWFKAAFKAWLESAKERWYSPVFWLFITPRVIVRLVLLACRE
jgi:hypothetical protein